MSLAHLSLKRPIFIACLVVLMLIVGFISLKTMPIDLFPDVTLPVVTVRTTYAGAGPAEIETQISKPLEDEISSIAGIESLRSENREGISQVIVEFKLEVDVKWAEQQVRAKVSGVRGRLPDDVDEPIIQTVDPADQPIVVISLAADLDEAALYDLANETIKPQISQVPAVGKVEILGGRKREIQIQLDRNTLRNRELGANQISKAIELAGQNVPVGKVDRGAKEASFRALGEFRDLEMIASTVLRFTGNENPIVVHDVADVVDTLQDETSRTYVNGKKSLSIYIYRQSKANTIAVVDGVMAQIARINKDNTTAVGKPVLTIVRDGSKAIRDNVFDVNESITIGIILTIIVVFFFLASFRSTLITSLALPNSLLGAFILMQLAGFSINIMSLLGLSLAVGLLIDDAIVVRENIHRHMELGKPPYKAALIGTTEVTLAVVAATFTILAVFGPIGFLSGIIGQYLKEFALTICFAMLISLFDALTIAPMMSAYFAGKHSHGEESEKKKGFFLGRWISAMLKSFDRFQTKLEIGYEWSLRHIVIPRPFMVIGASLAIFVASLYSVKYIPKTFLPTQDNGEVLVNIDLPPGTSLAETSRVGNDMDKIIRSNKEVGVSVLTIGNQNLESNAASVYIKLVPKKERHVNTTQFKDRLREQLKPLAYANPQVGDPTTGGGQKPFMLNVKGPDLDQIVSYSGQLLARLKTHAALQDVDTSHRSGKPEYQIQFNNARARMLGVQTAALGAELRTQVQGDTPAVFREGDREYDIRVRMLEDQRDIRDVFNNLMVPNMNGNLVPITAVAKAVPHDAAAKINRDNRMRYIQLSANIAPGGPGMGTAMQDIAKWTTTDLPLPTGVTIAYDGQAKRFGELIVNMMIAMGLGILFIYLVLCSLYESFITPFTVMLVFPLAICGAFFGLLVTQKTLDLFSMIGCVMLLGLATKNSILLVDYANQKMQEGMDRISAMIEAGRVRLRPIIMTTFALLGGMLPIAIGLNEASASRTSLGVAVMGGTISSTLLTLVVIPAAFSYIDRFREWTSKIFYRYIGSEVPRNFDADEVSDSSAHAPGKPSVQTHVPVAHPPVQYN